MLALYLYILNVFIYLRLVSPRRRIWVHHLNQVRETTGFERRIEIMRKYPDRFFKYFRMYPENFDYLLQLLRHRLQRQDTVMRRSISPELRLYVTLHYLSTGSAFTTIAFHYALGVSTVSKIVHSTCQAIWEELSAVYMPVPQTNQEWKNISRR